MRFQIVSFHCVLKNQLGSVMSTSFNQGVVTQAPNQVENQSKAELGALAEALKKLNPGESGKVYIPAQEAYGLYNPDLQIKLPRKKLKKGPSLKIGDTIQGKLTLDGRLRQFRVIHADSLHVIIDANHELAGQDLIFDVKLISSQEIEEPTEALPSTGWWQ